jgi:hypothetical protein
MDCDSSPLLYASCSSSSSVSFVAAKSSHGRNTMNDCPRSRKQTPLSGSHCCLYHQRSRFALFLKILLKRLRESSSFADHMLYQQARVITSRYAKSAITATTTTLRHKQHARTITARSSNHHNNNDINHHKGHCKNEGTSGSATTITTPLVARKDLFRHTHCPILDAVEVPLRELVGEHHWIRTHAYMRYYIVRTMTNKNSPAPSRSPTILYNKY